MQYPTDHHSPPSHWRRSTGEHLTLVPEFAAIALAPSHLGVTPYLGVPLAALSLIMMILSGGYLRWERIAICLCLLDPAWLVLAFLVQPKMHQVVHDTLIPHVPPGGITADLVFLVIGSRYFGPITFLDFEVGSIARMAILTMRT